MTTEAAVLDPFWVPGKQPAMSIYGILSEMRTSLIAAAFLQLAVIHAAASFGHPGLSIVKHGPRARVTKANSAAGMASYADWVRADQDRFRRLQTRNTRTTLCLWQAGNQQYAECTERINRMYAAKHGYEVQVIASDSVHLEGRAPYWGKLRALQACMQEEGQYVMYLDADAFVVQQHQTLEGLLFSDIDLHVSDHGDEQGMWANVNTGVIILKNTKWSRKFLQQWWVVGAETEFARNPYHEQTVLQHILQNGLYETREHVAVYPAHVFNTALDLDVQDSLQRFVMHMMSATKEGRATQCSSVIEQMLDKQAAWCRTQEIL